MANFHRGDVDLVLGERVFTLRLTLQSLAEIEAAFALADLGGLGERFGTGRIAAKDLVILLGAAVRGHWGVESHHWVMDMVFRDMPKACVA